MSGPHKLCVFVLIDALGWSVIKERDFLSDLLPYRQPLRTVLGFSSAAIPTILTGMPPAEHGHWNLFYYDPEGSPFWWLRYLSFLPNLILESRISRKILKELGRRCLGLGPLFECCVSPRLLPWFNWVEKKNIYNQRAITGAPSIFDHLSAAGVPYRVYTYHDASDNEILRKARSDIEGGIASFYFLYLSEMDLFLHHHCTDYGRINERLCWYETGIREIYASASKIDPEANLTVVSDHGMTPVIEHFDVASKIDALGFAMPQDYLVVYDSTMARFWFFNGEAEERIAEALRSLPEGRVISEEELCSLGVFFPDHRYGDLVFLLRPGWLLARNDFQGQWLPQGMHGYHPDDVYSDGIFLSTAPPPIQVLSNADVYQCMRIAADRRLLANRPVE